MSALFLTDEELRDLTRRVRYSAQARALRSMGIEHRTRPDGSVAVLRSHVADQLGGPADAAAAANDQEPNWDAI